MLSHVAVSRSRPRGSTLLRILLIAVLALAAVGLVTQRSVPPAQARYAPIEQAESEFEAEAARLVLPAGEMWPASGPRWVLAPDADLDGAVFETGFGTMVADTFWLCSWQREAIRLQESGSGDQSAFRALQAFPEMHAYRASWDDSGRHLFATRMEALERGDVRGMVADVRDNCGPER